MNLRRSKRSVFPRDLGGYLVKVCRLLFKTALVTFIAYFLLERFKTGLISNYFDLNLLLILAIITSVFVIILPKEEQEKIRHKNWPAIFWLILALLLAAFIWQQLKAMGPLALAISSLSALAFYTVFNIKLGHHD